MVHHIPRFMTKHDGLKKFTGLGKSSVSSELFIQIHSFIN